MSNSEANKAQYLEEDEIDLRELWKTILAGKKVIFALVAIVVSVTFIYALSLPNVYKSEAVLIPSENKTSGLGGLGGLAAMAGVDIGGGGTMTPDVAFNSLLGNYEFMRKFVIENKIVERKIDKDFDKNYVFALGYRGVYDFFHSKDSSGEKERDFEEDVYKTVKNISANFSISSDKKTALISVAFTDSDRNYPPLIIEMFLKDASKYLVDNNLRIINNKLGYFEAELRKSESFELRQSISAMVSKILEEKVLMQSKIYYQCDILTEPAPAYIRDKTKPKRALILIVSFVTSIIFGIFLVFFLQFIRQDSAEQKL
jgi:capsular polysaccharide biosynthesis protein